MKKVKTLVSFQIRKNVDCETPVSIYQKVKGKGPSFLLESVEGQEKWARYSFIGIEPIAVFQSYGKKVFIQKASGKIQKRVEDPLAAFEAFFHSYRLKEMKKDLPRFFGGAVGFLSYEMVRFFEKLPRKKKQVGAGLKPAPTPDSYFILPRILVIFDNIRHTVDLVGFGTKKEMGTVKKKIQGISEKIDGGITDRPPTPSSAKRPCGIAKEGGKGEVWKQNWSSEQFQKAVHRVKKYILSGDVTQTVLSLCQSAPFSGDPFDLYRSLRRLNPSPYLFYLEGWFTQGCFTQGEGFVLLGASPETMVRLEGRQLVLRPIAGTRPRDPDPVKDQALEKELLADPKERAEHIMLVDLGRNDLGRVATVGTVIVDQLMRVESYSHVRHLVSNVRAELASGKNAFDVIRATFPAGTLTGSPKIRAMEIIEELEPTTRGVYGGCIGYFSFSGNMDTAITIRSAFIHKKQISVQAGAGIVADSDPEREYNECLNKAKSVISAILEM